MIGPYDYLEPVKIGHRAMLQIYEALLASRIRKTLLNHKYPDCFTYRTTVLAAANVEMSP